MSSGSLHSQNSCYLPLQQLDQDYHSPRIIQVAGSYPGITLDEFTSVTTTSSAEQGQWAYDFADPDGPQVGTVAIAGSDILSGAEEPVVIIAEHTSINVSLPEAIKEPVDLVVLVDRAIDTFAERKFVVYSTPSGGAELSIGAFASKSDMPSGCIILGRVLLTLIPWLPAMKSTKTGFMEQDEYF